MQTRSSEPVDLPFSHKYTQDHAEEYFRKHRSGLSRQVSSWREIALTRKALQLAGQPNTVLDLPCGAGRFWPMLMEKPNRFVIGADNSADMLTVARDAYPEYSSDKIRCLQTSAFAIDLPESAVDSILCLRLLHHIREAGHRQQILREFPRVARDTVILSLWVDGNYKAWRRKRLEERRRRQGQPDSVNRFVHNQKQIEAEFASAGFNVIGHFDMVPLYQMWRTYVLRKR